ncbi:MAG: hypothetical protein PHY93_07860 [Bacteriovorax sp.]|nr:hypothetical protein [Bacteriovorax sp.]
MKASKFLSCLAVFTFVAMISDLALAAPVKKIKIASYIGVEIGGDIGQYEVTLAYSRNQTRKMYMDEVIDAAVKMSGGIFDPTDMLGPLQKLQESADGKRDLNKEIDSVKIGLSVGEFFKSEIEKLHRANGITNAERKIEFANAFPVINGHMVYNSKVQYDHYIFIQMAHIGSGQFKMSGTLGTINEDGIERSFEGVGYLKNALAQVAEGIFRSIMEIDRPAWKNPNSTLTWIPGPANISSLDSKEARSYCAGQDARLPLADELILAHHGTAYRNGGIDRFRIGENYFVGDQMRQAGVPYVVIFENVGENGKATVQPVAGQYGKVWCVKGSMNERNKLIQKLYSIRRKLDPEGISIRFFPENVSSSKLPAIIAIESLLINLNAANAELNVSLMQEDLMSSDEAINELSAAGISITISKSILDALI